jgi:hypothetical protein
MARTKAAVFITANARQAMLEIAKRYDNLAEMAQKLSATRSGVGTCR